jgi:tetratricopeptide (TPR) repeat protein
LAAREREVDEAQRLLSRAVQLKSEHYSDAMNVFLFDLQRPDLARELAGDDYVRLSELAAACAASKEYAKLATGFETDSETSLRRRTEANDASAQELATLADIEFTRCKYEKSIALYRRALTKEYRQLDWRIRLARALAETGRFDDGINELRICLRLRQNHPDARKLLDELLTKPSK